MLMCLAVPARLLSLEGDDAVVDLGGARTRVSVALIEDPQPGDWLVIHTGYALSRIDESAAQTLARELDSLMAETAP
jgi:hydrogenase expression/formation protein HypC